MKLDLRMKIVLVGIGGFIAVAATLNVISYRDARRQARQLYVEKARSVILAAESAREEMAQGLFTKEQLREWAEQGETGKILATVPVVTAWKTSMAKADEGGYTFKVPKFQPRNPENEPDPLEADVLRKLENENLAEYSFVDKDLKAIRYFRPIRLTTPPPAASCGATTAAWTPPASAWRTGGPVRCTAPSRSCSPWTRPTPCSKPAC